MANQMRFYIVAVQVPYGGAQAPLPLSPISPTSATVEPPSFIPSLFRPNPVYTFRTEYQATETAIAGAGFNAQSSTVDMQDISDMPDTTHIDPQYESTSEFVTNPWEFSRYRLPAWITTKIKSTKTYLSPLITHKSVNPLCWLLNFSNFPCSNEALSPWDTKTCHKSSKENSLSNDSDDVESESNGIPSYVLEYAPFVHLCSDEEFWPGDMEEHLAHIAPHFNYIPLSSKWNHPSLQDLDELNFFKHGFNIYLTSDDDVEDRPTWLGGERNIPLNSEHASGAGNRQKTSNNEREHHDPREADPRERESFISRARRSKQWITSKKPVDGEDGKSGKSSAPAVLIVVDKGDGIVDAFWFYFYSFNQGNIVLNVRFGNHVGDWEHSLVRFHNGVPQTVFLSEHSAGEAYSYDALEKIGKRVSIYKSLVKPFH